MGESPTATPGFWEIGAYKTNVRRIKDGMEQIEELGKMAKERAEIECKYAKTLQAFSERWRGQVERTVHDGAIKGAWLELLEESEALAIQHNRVKDRLLDEIVRTLSLYRKENHHPSAFRSPKEIREIEEAFEKAQKQWKKLYEKVESAKRAYHGACRSEKSIQVQLSNSQADTSISKDALSKMEDRHQKTKDEVIKTRKSYENFIQEIAQYRGPYVENMTFVFEKCQLAEMKRAKFVVEMMSGAESVYADLVRNNKFGTLHNKIEHKIKGMDEGVLNDDLKEWSDQFGVNSPTEWPVYEEYTPEMRNIAHRRTTTKDTTGGVVLTRQIIKNEDVPQPGPANTERTNTLQPEATKHVGSKDSDSDTNTYDSRRTDSKERREVRRPIGWDVTESLPATTPDSAKYADFDDDHSPVQLSVIREATALYDYTPMEDDEIPLKKGQKIELLSEPDNLGWCQGRVGTVTGLFPASYVQSV